MFEFYGLSNEENIEKSVKAKLCENSGIKQLVLSWRVKKGERGEWKDRGYIDDDVMKILESHPNLKESIVEGFPGMKPALWINKMANLVTITIVADGFDGTEGGSGFGNEYCPLEGSVTINVEN
ncbi:hypothetical protein POM88_011326 [Heracleum sosnowskyi]|uniref:R13L1/DRL21-like LRR repeat region domain-containing protein n=1 Tax=Heracleum sosnowskyi TaxID=360622 RepID=A0AAD8IUR1_9APIA|nr:hypothetical protein POM88_011326 [Heracleum sosnowskyi]